MTLDGERAALLEQAQVFVRRFVQERGGFSMFALAKHRDGALNPMQPTDEFPDDQAAIVEIYRLLMALARDEQIVASVICTHIAVGPEQAAMFDVESKAAGRVLVMLPMKRRLLRGWAFGDPHFKNDGPRVFVQ